ncbi:MAG: nuclear transport factor 2 family protein [Acidimicrobiales bacterium]
MNHDADLSERVARIEDELAIRHLVLTYGPSADAGLADRAASVWLPDGEYDWDADGTPHQGREAVEAMLLDDGHQGLIRSGVAHFAGPPLIEVDGDRATALTYSLIMRREPDTGRFYLWRVSAARWDLERRSGTWGVRRRVNRLMDETGAGRTLFGDTLAERFEGGQSR